MYCLKWITFCLEYLPVNLYCLCNFWQAQHCLFIPTAIREDRTRGGRSTYQCAPYPLPPSLVTPTTTSGHQLDPQRLPDATAVKAEPSDGEEIKPSPSDDKRPIPLLLQVCFRLAVFIQPHSVVFLECVRCSWPFGIYSSCTENYMNICYQTLF